MTWSIDQIAVGDLLHVRATNTSGDRNLHGCELRGIVVEINRSHRFAKLADGWCCHEKDELVEHRSAPKAGVP